MLKVLSEFSGAGSDLSLCYPLLKFIHLPVELIKPVLLLQTGLPLLHQILQRHVQPVDLRLALTDLFTEAQTYTNKLRSHAEEDKSVIINILKKGIKSLLDSK